MATRTVLVVDDCLDDAFRINCHFNDISDFQHRFQHISSVDEARATILGDSVDIALVAAGIESDKGQLLLRELRSTGYEKSIIMLCGDEHLELIAELMRNGADDCVLKSSCTAGKLRNSVQVALDQYTHRRTREQQTSLLTRTLTASVKILIEILASTRPRAFARAIQARDVVRCLSKGVEEARGWEIEVAVMLSPLGCLHLPESLIDSLNHNRPLNSAEAGLYGQHPKNGADIIRKIPRMAGVADIVAYQEKNFDGSGYPEDDIGGDAIPIGARILKIAMDFQAQRRKGYANDIAVDELERQSGRYDPQILALLRQQLSETTQFTTQHVRVSELSPHMILDDHITTRLGAVVIQQGSTISEHQRLELVRLSDSNELREPFRVRVPHQSRAAVEFGLEESDRHFAGFLDNRPQLVS